MVGKTQPITKADRERFRCLHEIGCIVSRLYLGVYSAPQIHHITEGGRRLGHQYTLPLNPWFHQGQVPPEVVTAEQATRLYGPSLALNKRAFVARFGTERELLEQVNQLLEAL